MTINVQIDCTGLSFTTSDYTADNQGMWSVNGEPPRNLELNTTVQQPWPEFSSVDGHYTLSVMVVSATDLAFNELQQESVDCPAPVTASNIADVVVPEPDLSKAKFIVSADSIGGSAATHLTPSTIVSLPATGARDVAPIAGGAGALLALGVALVSISRRRWAR